MGREGGRETAQRAGEGTCEALRASEPLHEVITDSN